MQIPFSAINVGIFCLRIIWYFQLVNFYFACDMQRSVAYGEPVRFAQEWHSSLFLIMNWFSRSSTCDRK